jgi:hypothetical protein
MTKRTRYFLVGATAVLVLGLCTGLVAYYGGGLRPLSVAQAGASGLLSYVPADATLVAYANVQDVMHSQFRERFREAVPEQNEGRDEFLRETGIDVERDIDEVVACVLKVGDHDDGGLVVASGRFNPTQLETLARGHGGTVEDYRGTRLLVARASEPGLEGTHKKPTLAFMAPGLIAIGDDASIRKAIDAQINHLSVLGNDELMDLVKGLDVSANAWAVGRLDTLAAQAKLPEEVSRQIPPLKWFAATGRVDGGLSGTLRAEARDEQAADNLRDVIRGLFALAKMQAGNDPKVAALVQTLQLSGTGTTVQLSFTVPSEVLDLLAAARKAHMK